MRCHRRAEGLTYLFVEKIRLESQPWQSKEAMVSVETHNYRIEVSDN